MTIQEKFDLSGRTAVVTGSAGLLGKEFCRTLAEAGASVVVADLDGKAAGSVAGALVDSGYRAVSIPLDVTRIESVRELATKTVSEFGSLDILVNSAALDPKFDPDAAAKGIAPGAFEDYPLEQWNAALSVNGDLQLRVTPGADRLSRDPLELSFPRRPESGYRGNDLPFVLDVGNALANLDLR